MAMVLTVVVVLAVVAVLAEVAVLAVVWFHLHVKETMAM